MNLPYVVDGDRVVSQTNACMSYLGRKLGLWGNTDDEVIDVEQLLCEVYDLRGGMVRFAYGASPEKAVETMAGQKEGSLHKLELWLAGST